MRRIKDIVTAFSTQEEGTDSLVGSSVGDTSATSIATNSRGRPRLRWQPITTLLLIDQCEGVITTHPFLKNRHNWMDTMLVSELVGNQPVAVSRGPNGEAWRAFAQSLSLTQDPDGYLNQNVHSNSVTTKKADD